MNKFVATLVLLVGIFSSAFYYTNAQDGPVLTATLDSQTPLAQSLSVGVQDIDVAKITLTASGGDVELRGIYLATDIPGGLSNFTNIKIYDTYDSTLLDTYPNQSASPNLVKVSGVFNAVIIGNGQHKTYLLRASLASSAVGNVRLGFSGFTNTTQDIPTSALVGVPIYGNTMTLPGATPTPTPSPSPSPSATPTPSPTPSPSPTPTPINRPTPASKGFVSLEALNLTEGDTISAAGSSDPDIYIANQYGYKRLFLNPVIFGFYGHLHGFAGVKSVTPLTRDTLVTSGLFRNCETNDQRVYGLEVTGEDTGLLHWVNTSGTQAVTDDPSFFSKVFCINTNEFNWYQKGSDYTSVNQVPMYSR